MAGIYAFKPVNVTNTSGTTSIRTEGAGDVYGIYAAGGNKATRPEGGKVSFTGNLDISVTGKMLMASMWQIVRMIRALRVGISLLTGR